MAENKNPHGLKVGQELWWVGSNNRSASSVVTVSKVGRTWAELNNRHRIDMQTLVADGKGYNSPGRCYLSREIYEAILNREVAWGQLRRDIANKRGMSQGVTPEDIASVRKLLRLDSEAASADKGGRHG